MRKTLIPATLTLLLVSVLACATTDKEADLQTLKRLEEAGSDLSKPHELEFFLYFPNKASADAAAADIREQGFVVEVRPPGEGSDWLCFAVKTVVPTYEAISAISREFNAIAEARGGEYDGWGTLVVK
jgi:regulator of RNase E activity RraB